MSRIITVAGVDVGLKNMGMATGEVDIDTGALLRVTTIQLVQTEKRAGKDVRKNSDDLRRMAELYRAFQAFAAGKTVVFGEMPTGSQSADGMKMIGATTMLLATSPVPIIQVQPSETKTASVGKKSASKPDIIRWAYDKWPELEWITHPKAKLPGKLTAANEHMADGCAIIQAGVQTDQFQQLLSLLRAQAA